MFANRYFTFTGSQRNDKLNIVIPEVADPEYGMYTWPCAPVMAQYLWYHRDSILGKTILELGSGTSLPGIVAAKCGANVHLSDSAALPKCLETSINSCKANDLSDIQVHGITWGKLDNSLLGLGLNNLDMIIASDCFYNTKDFEDVIVTVSFLMKKYKTTEFVFTYQERSSSRSIEYLLDKWKLTGEEIPLCSFDADKPSIAGSGLPGSHTIHLFQVKQMSS